MTKYYERRPEFDIFFNHEPATTFAEMLQAGYKNIRLDFNGNDVDSPRLLLANVSEVEPVVLRDSGAVFGNKSEYGWVVVKARQYVVVKEDGSVKLTFDISRYEEIDG